MPARRLRALLLLILTVGLTCSIFFCKSPKTTGQSGGPQSDWKNVYDTSVHYVGMERCQSCHTETHQHFMHTGMGQSFDWASHEKSAASYTDHSLVYDPDKDFYYKPFFNGDSLYILEYRLDGKDTIHKRLEAVNYIIGSGQHTNSHIIDRNGYLFQAPITFYTQKGRWDLAPGFEKGGSKRFSRLIELECMSCHNGLPELVPGSENKYTVIKRGIDCERCHGPGSLHVQEKSSGIIVDTSRTPDYSIVNPRRLSTELQNNICQRCHLQGISVLKEGKSFTDFRPGMRLSEIEDVFMPQYEGAADKMIMASHVERMKKSQCYIRSGALSCITCHNPHLSVKETPRAQFNNACGRCHGGAGQTACTEKLFVRGLSQDDCVKCHMAKNSSIDIPHVAVTDHDIRRRPLSEAEKTAITAFLGLRCYNNDQVDALTTARAYMEFFEKFNESPAFIDSTFKYLAKDPKAETARQNQDYIRAYFLLGQYQKVVEYGASMKPAAMNDAWTAYRIGEACFQLSNPAQALPWYQRAVALLPLSADFRIKQGVCQLALNDLSSAEQSFQFVLKEQPENAAASGNLGFICMQRGERTLAYDYFQRSLSLDPDQIQVQINLAVWLHNDGNLDRCRTVLQRLLKRHPGHAQATAMLRDLSRQ